jgi:hypothetical protein
MACVSIVTGSLQSASLKEPRCKIRVVWVRVDFELGLQLVGY